MNKILLFKMAFEVAGHSVTLKGKPVSIAQITWFKTITQSLKKENRGMILSLQMMVATKNMRLFLS